jgi:serine/threonine protein kinase
MSTTDQLTPGMELGRSELLMPIAQGGMATVWAGRQKGARGFQKTVAVKTMLPALSDDPQFEEMFLDEAKLAERIRHPNVVEIYELGEQAEVVFMVMEWIDGEALSVLARAAKKAETPIPVRVVLKIAAQACAGLHAAHELKDEDGGLLHIVHRDVSPQNILVTYDGLVKVVDFGVAKATNRSSNETTAGQIKGKIPYMSPEQARGGDVDRRTDIFAMGIVLYKLLTGVHPFSGETDIVTMKNIIASPVVAPISRNPELPRDLDALVLKCLHKDPDRRFSSMQELQHAIETVIASMGAGTLDEVGAFVRMLVGERGQKRRAAIRDAARTLDERTSTMSVPRPSLQPQVHESVSGIALTGVQSGITREAMPAAVMQGQLPESTQSVVGAAPVPAPAPQTRLGLLAAAIAFAAITLGLAIFFGLRGSQPAPAAQPTPPISAPTATDTGPGTETATAPPQQVPTTDASAASSAAPVASATDLASLPSVGTSSPKVGGPKPGAGPAPTVVPRLKSTAWVPTVQEPGF